MYLNIISEKGIEVLNQFLVEVFRVVFLPDSVAFFNDTEKLIVDKIEKKTSPQCMTARLGQNSSKDFLFVGCCFLCAVLQCGGDSP